MSVNSRSRTATNTRMTIDIRAGAATPPPLINSRGDCHTAKAINKTASGPEYITKGNTVFVLRTVYSGDKTAKELMAKALDGIIRERSKKPLEFHVERGHNVG